MAQILPFLHDDWSAQVTSARAVPWNNDSWGVSVEFEDDFSVTYPVPSQKNAFEHCDKVKNDPEFALKVRWGRQ
jgi:hypothetical protein